MKKIALGNAVQVLANLAVLIGIVFLVIEINQATVTTRASMISTYQDRWMSIDLSIQDAEFAEAWATAIDSPEELTTAQMIQVNGSIWAFIDQVDANRLLWELDVFRDPAPPTEIVVNGNAPIVFGNEYAQAWWAETRTAIHPETRALIDSAIEGAAGASADYYDRIRSRVAR